MWWVIWLWRLCGGWIGYGGYVVGGLVMDDLWWVGEINEKRPTKFLLDLAVGVAIICSVHLFLFKTS